MWIWAAGMAKAQVVENYVPGNRQRRGYLG